MAIEPQTSSHMMIERRAPSGPETFPGKMCLFALLVLSGLYCYLIFVVPDAGTEESTWAARAALWLARLVESHPIASGALLAILLVPAAVLREEAVPYLLRLIFLAGALWTATVFSSPQPGGKLAETVRSVLSMPREFPETIHGR